MYASWLRPSPVDRHPYAPHTLGAQLTDAVTERSRVVIIGMEAATADRVRPLLYAMAWDFGTLEIVDLGNLRTPTVDFAIPLLRELYRSGIVPVLLGRGAGLLESQYLAFGDLNRQVGLCCIDQHVALSSGRRGDRLLDAAVYREALPLYHLMHVGSQQHLNDPQLEVVARERHFEFYGLGRARAGLAELEPAVRDADLLMFNVGALAMADCPDQEGVHASGFSLQEAGQLCYYAGNSDRLSSFSVYGIAGSAESPRATELSHAAYAQMAWYFLYGVSRRHGDFPARTDGLTEYVIDTAGAGRLTFWRSPRSSRWWVQVPVDDYRGEDRNRLVACSQHDYQRTSQEGKVPDRILAAFARY